MSGGSRLGGDLVGGFRFDLEEATGCEDLINGVGASRRISGLLKKGPCAHIVYTI